MKLNGTRVEKKSPRKITEFQPRNGGQKNCLAFNPFEVKWRVNKKTTTRKKQASKFCQQKHGNTRLFRRITRPFNQLLICPFTLQRLVRVKFHFKTINPSFRWAGVKWFHFNWSGPYAGSGWENPDRWSPRH